MKMPAMKARWSKKCVFVCACACSSFVCVCVCGSMVAQLRCCCKLWEGCMGDYLGHEAEEILHFETCY